MHRLRLHHLLALALPIATALPAAAQGTQTYAVTVTNVTRGQVISPPIVVSHDKGFAVWRAGAAASPELAAVAEDAEAAGLLALLGAEPAVRDVAMAGAPLMPGHSVTLEVEARFPFDRLTALGMLVTTNDAFFGLGGAALPQRRMREHHYAVAYDAGSEANNEDCDFIPGPPCDNPGVRDTADAEGFVHVHAGVHGLADLVPAMHDWRNPVARITVQAVR